MIDYLMSFTNEAEAKEVLLPLAYPEPIMLDPGEPYPDPEFPEIMIQPDPTYLYPRPFPIVQQVGDEVFWNRSIVFTDLKLFTQVASYDEQGNQITPNALIDDQFWVLVSLADDAPAEALTSLDACQVVANRERAKAGLGFIYPTGLRASVPQIMSVVRIDGLPAGSSYPFSTPAIIEE